MGRAFEYRKHRKFARWAKMAKAFTKAGREIAMAVKEGGGEIDYNPRLRLAVQNAKSVNMPKDRIEAAIKRASEKDSSNYEEVTYQGYGPHGIGIIVDCATDNTTRTVANVRSYFNKYGGSLGKTGSLDYMFEKKCVFRINGEGLDAEELEFELIDFGAEEVEKYTDEEDEKEYVMIYADFNDFGNIQKALEEKSLELVEAQYEKNPMNKVKLDDSQKKDLEKLLDKFEEDEDVLNVFHNIEGM
ncbi:MAG: YebC/PmpR family DNA-binding transcriptional regulator [Chitinophagales bacterium]